MKIPSVFDILCLVLALVVWQTKAITVVSSNSMAPTFERGAMLFGLPFAHADKGDIIIFKNKDANIVHRVISNDNGCYVTQGDANYLPDSMWLYKGCIKDDVVKVMAWVPFAGYPALFFQSLPIWAQCLIGAFLIFFLGD